MNPIAVMIKQVIKNQFPSLVYLYHERRKKYYYKYYEKSVTPWGFTFFGSPEMRNGTFERDETDIALELMRDCDVFVDIGANVGYFTCLARNAGYKVISIEPLIDNLAYLYENVRHNSWGDVEIFPMAVAEKPGNAEIYGGGTGASLLQGWSGSSKLWSKHISISTLDIILGDRFEDSNIFIKMDVEGFEYQVLQGAINTLGRRKKPKWLIEVCYDEHHPDGINPNFFNTFNIMWDYGYKSYTADNKKEEVHEGNIKKLLNKPHRIINYIFIEDKIDE